ncbi:hypothetical protein DY000_02048596 [Brassica cretica]|uniref:Uncharacterized protein n=1 Tax=Brassica cretica TaxID=69181 RepID=A0ABQ7EXH3_BRACR|nr:hypothetical protein DY000_02048596 [Brassica cretica]
MDFQGWDPGDQRITRSNWRFSSDNRWADSHYYDGYNGGWKQKEGRAQTDLSDLQRNLRGIGKSILAKRGESERSPISNQSRELSSHILQSRDLSGMISISSVSISLVKIKVGWGKTKRGRWYKSNCRLFTVSWDNGLSWNYGTRRCGVALNMYAGNLYLSFVTRKGHIENSTCKGTCGFYYRIGPEM